MFSLIPEVFFDRNTLSSSPRLSTRCRLLTCALIAGDIVILCTLNILTVIPAESYSVSNRGTAHMINVNRMPIRGWWSTWLPAQLVAESSQTKMAAVNDARCRQSAVGEYRICKTKSVRRGTDTQNRRFARIYINMCGFCGFIHRATPRSFSQLTPSSTHSTHVDWSYATWLTCHETL